jgi:hypothetical protein
MKIPAVKGFDEEAFKYLKNTGWLMLGRIIPVAIVTSVFPALIHARNRSCKVYQKITKSL